MWDYFKNYKPKKAAKLPKENQMNTTSVVESYIVNSVTRIRKATTVSKKASDYIQKHINRNIDKVILSKPPIRVYHPETVCMI